MESAEQATGRTKLAKSPSSEDDAIRNQTERVLAHHLFSQSKRCRNLLRFVVDQTLEGDLGNLKERMIGILVFARAPDYDTNSDPTVRVAATEVRRRLALYYNEPEHATELRITVPVGSYVGVFTNPPNADKEEEQGKEEQAVLQAQPKRRNLYAALGSAMIILGLVTWIALKLLTPEPVVDKFWRPFFDNPGKYTICVGSVQATGLPAANTAASQPSQSVFELSQGRVRPAMADVVAGATISSYLEHRSKDSVTKSAPDTTLDDLRSNPAVLLGSFNNEWAVRLGAHLPFRLLKESASGVRWIADTTRPPNRAWALDMSIPSQDLDTDYALVSRIFDQNTGQWWIGVAGLTGSSTVATSQLLVDPKSISQAATGFPKGWEKRDLQLVFAVPIIHGSPGQPLLVAAHAW